MYAQLISDLVANCERYIVERDDFDERLDRFYRELTSLVEVTRQLDVTSRPLELLDFIYFYQVEELYPV